jgi:hypothetical protein
MNPPEWAALFSLPYLMMEIDPVSEMLWFLTNSQDDRQY